MAFAGPGPGRPKGMRNKATREIKMLAQKYGPDIIKRLAKIAKSEDHKDQIRAMEVLLDRGYGKATQAHEHSGPDGGPIEHMDVTNLTDAELDAFETLAGKAAAGERAVEGDPGGENSTTH
jgi:hypothetical protein